MLSSQSFAEVGAIRTKRSPFARWLWAARYVHMFILVSAILILNRVAECQSFEVVSIKAAKPNEPWSIGTTNGDFHARNVVLGKVLLNAFFPSSYRSSSLLVNAPGWVWADRYDIEAKVASDHREQWMRERPQFPAGEDSLLQKSLITMLRSRCNLVTHRVSAETNGFQLIVRDKERAAKSLIVGAELIPATAKLIPGGGYVELLNGGDELSFYSTSMDSLSKELALLSGAPVEDGTGLLGSYRFVVEHSADQFDEKDLMPSFRGQWDLHALGLDLKPAKLTIQKVFVERIEHPSAN